MPAGRAAKASRDMIAAEMARYCIKPFVSPMFIGMPSLLAATVAVNPMAAADHDDSHVGCRVLPCAVLDRCE